MTQINTSSHFDDHLGVRFTQIAQAYGLRPALIYPEGEVSYEQLENLSEQVKHWLIERAIKQGEVVAIFNDKSPLGFALMIACLKLGIIYCNLDYTSPRQRIERMFSTSTPVLLVYANEFSELATSLSFCVECINYGSEEFQRAIASATPTEEVNRALHDCAAYIMFTSGSTGFPKGAVMSHGNVLNLIDWSHQTFQIHPDDRMTNLNPIYFDNSVFDFYASLFNGAALIPIRETLLREPRGLIKKLNDLLPTLWFSVPSLLVYILRLRALGREDLRSLRAIVFGGEGFPKAQLRRLYELVGHRLSLINVYGPTECTCICSFYVVEPRDLELDDLLPLGHIAENFDYLILDEMQAPVEAGAQGELALLGPCVGLGYYQDPERSAQSFIQNPKSDDYPQPCYLTGDLVVEDLETKMLHFKGRRDHQIKKMGYRIELEEIEIAIGSIPTIEEAAVLYERTEAGLGRIVAVIVSDVMDEQTLLAQLRAKLPPYMIPDRAHFISELPKNQNGKIDRLKLTTLLTSGARIR